MAGRGGGGRQARGEQRLVVVAWLDAACGPADGARDTGAGPVLPRRRPWPLTSPGPGPDRTDYFCPLLII